MRTFAWHARRGASMPKRNDSAVDLHAQLQASLAGAESTVVDAAVSACELGDADLKVPESIRAAVRNLLAIRAGIAGMAKHVSPKAAPKKQEPTTAPAPKPASGPVTRPAVPATAKA